MVEDALVLIRECSRLAGRAGARGMQVRQCCSVVGGSGARLGGAKGMQFGSVKAAAAVQHCSTDVQHNTVPLPAVWQARAY